MGSSLKRVKKADVDIVVWGPIFAFSDLLYFDIRIAINLDIDGEQTVGG